MKKYNLSKIMKRAWELVKKVGMTISAGLKEAWREAKMTLREQVLSELKKRIEIAPDVYDYEIVESDWVKYGKNRTYFKVIETRKNSRHYGVREYGYIDNITNKYFAGKNDAFGEYDFSGSVMK